jgi:ankyrin repeat protein
MMQLRDLPLDNRLDIYNRARIVHLTDVHGNIDRALAESSYEGNLQDVKLLLRAGANVNTAPDFLYSPLRGAAMGNHVAVMQVLLAAGANVHANGEEELYLAAAHGNFDVVQLLLAAGANVHTQDALGAARENHHMDVVQALLDAGAIADSDEDDG